jgi:hypothetical protein
MLYSPPKRSGKQIKDLEINIMKKTNNNQGAQASITRFASNENKFFIVTAKCGHVRRANYIPIDFPVASLNGKEAAAIARQLPRVKHDHKDAILFVREVSREEYDRQSFINKNDPFLRITNRREHEVLVPLFENRIEQEFDTAPYKSARREDSNKIIHFGKERIRNPRKWARLNDAA